MKFIGIIEADINTAFMMNMPILGIGISDGCQYCIGQITGNLSDLATLGHVYTGIKLDFKEWLNELQKKNELEDFPKEYQLSFCTHKEACEKALGLYDDFMEIKTFKGPSITFDMRLIKNRLRNVIESQS